MKIPKILGSAVARNGIWDAGQQTLTVACNSVIAILLVKFLPVDEYGAYSYAIAAVTIALTLMSAGLSGLAVKLLVNDRPQNAAIMLHLLFARLLFAVIGYGLVIAISVTSADRMVIFATAVASLALFGKSLEAPELWFLSHLRSRRVASIRLIASFILVVVRLAFLVLLPSLWIFVSLYAIETMITGLAIFIRYQSDRQSPGWRYSGFKQTLVESASTIRQSFPLMISGMANQINLKSDIIVLQALTSVSAVAVYSLAAKVSELAYFFPVVFMNALLPRLTSLKKSDVELYSRTLQRAYDLSFWVGVTLALSIGGIGAVAIPYFLGSQYTASSSVLAVHVIAAPFVFMAAVYSKWIIVEGVLWTSVWRHAAGAVLNVGLCFALIPHLGPMGAAYSTVVSYVVASYAAAFFTTSTRRQAMMMSLAIVAPVRYLFVSAKRIYL